MANTFNQAHLDALAKIVPNGTLVKRSAYYNRAVVIGRPDQSGAILLSQEQEEDAEGRFPFRMNVFFDCDPKKVADGKASLLTSFDEVFYNWGDLVKFVTVVTNSGFSEAVYWKM